MSILKPVLGSQLQLGHPLSNGLVGYWLMNEGSGDKVADLSGNGNTGTLQGSTFWTPGRFGSALSFDRGTDDYIDAGGVVHDLDNDQITVVVGCSLSTLNYNSAICGQRGDADANSGWRFQFNTVPVGDVLSFGSFGNWDQSSTALNISANEQLHFAFTYDKQNVVFYKSGALLSSHARTDAVIPSPRDLYLGAYNDQGSFSTEWNGLIDYILIYNRALSAQEIQQLYISPFCMFSREPIELCTGAMAGGEPPEGNAGIMTTWGGYWGATY